jgi:hypothetical protein
LWNAQHPLHFLQRAGLLKRANMIPREKIKNISDGYALPAIELCAIGGVELNDCWTTPKSVV